ncbi:MAG: alpha/beta fold hydrolase [Desulfitobacteriaceae bacterium]
MSVQNIVLIHGWASDESIWQETRNYLEQKHRVYTLNLPLMKHKHSYRDAVLEMIEQKGLAQVIVVGWSMGALIAIQVAHQTHKVRGLVLVGGTSRFLMETQLELVISGSEQTLVKGIIVQKSFPYESLPDKSSPSIKPYPGGIPTALVKRMKKRLSKNVKQTLTDFYKLMFSHQEQAQGIDKKVTDFYLGCGINWDIIGVQAGLDFLGEVDLRAELKAITCSTLILHGEQDEICPIEGAKFIQEQIPCAQLVSYPKVGHIPFLTNFAGFHRDLEEWLSIYDGI